MGNRILSYFRESVTWFAAMILLLSQLLFPIIATGQAFAATNDITVSDHEGQIDPSGAYTNGNITQYSELDSVNFRFTLDAADASSGQMQVEYTENDGFCSFWDGSFSLGTHDASATAVVTTSGATPTVTPTSSPTDVSGEWVQLLDVTFPAAGQAVVNYYITLTDEAGNCNGSSQHSRLANSATTGDFANIGAQNVPVPAKDIIELSQITVSKFVDEDGDGISDRKANAGEWSFSLNGGTPVPTDASGDVVFANLDTGDYDVTEVQNVGYELLSRSGTNCVLDANDDLGMIASVEAAANNPVEATCNFKNGEIQQATLILEKTVVNDDGGTLSETDFPVFIDGVDSAWGSHDLDAGDFVVSETPNPGYEAGPWGGDCDAQGNVTLAPGETKTCTIINDDIAPALTLEKVVINDDGGLADEDDFQGYINAQPTDWSDPVAITAGVPYVASEDIAEGYELQDIECRDNLTQDLIEQPVVLELAQAVTCVITNDDVAPTLTLVKTVVNDHGGTAAEGDFQARVNGDPVSWSVAVEVTANIPITASEDVVNGYAPSDWTGDCNAAGEIVLEPGEEATCYITNDDIAPLIVIEKEVVNDDGGTLVVSDFPLYVDGQLVVSGEQNDWTAGTFAVTEDGQDGYALTGFGGDCDLTGNITLEIGGVYTCTVTNDDIPATITVIKEVVNDDGGTATVGNFELFVNDTQVVSNVANTFNGNQSYSISENALVTGYEQTSLTCYDVTDQPVMVDNGFTAELGRSYECTIVNDDIAPNLGVQKIVINNDGGQLFADEFDLYVNGDGPLDDARAGGGDVFNNTVVYLAPNIVAGVEYTVTEDEIDGYSPSEVTCIDTVTQTPIDHPVTLSPGQNVRCTITNDDQAGSLTLVKTVVNDDGGQATEANFEAFIATDQVAWGATTPVSAGNYSVSEATVTPGYSPSAWTGDCEADGSVSVANGQDAVCYITNDDVAPTLTLEKVVINNNGGDATQDEWRLMAQGAGLLVGYDTGSGVSDTVPAGLYGFAEFEGPVGYELTSIVCNGQPLSLDDPQYTIGLAESVTCVFTNDDISPTLKVTKYATNDDGGDVTAEQFEITINGGVFVGGSSGTPVGDVTTHTYGPINIAANAEFTIGENVPTGYENTYISCFDITDGIPGVPIDNPVTADEGRDILCNVGNDDIAPTLTIEKTVVNDNGGQAVEDDFQGYIGGVATDWDTATEVFANQKITVSEDVYPGYSPSVWGGDCAVDGTITLEPGENLTCTITNDDIAPELSLYKIVIDEYGAGYEPVDWTLIATPETNTIGATEVSGNGADGVEDETIFANVLYNLSESGPDGFTPTEYECFGKGSFQWDANTLVASNAADITCVITNNAIAPHLVVIKNVINDDHLVPEDGKTAGDFTIFVAATDVSDDEFPGEATPGTDLTLDVGPYLVYENEDDAEDMGYAVSYSDDCESTISLGETKTCVVTNDDIPPTLRLVKRALSINQPITQEFDLSAAQDGNTLGSPHTVGVDEFGFSEEVVLDKTDGLKIGEIVVSEDVPSNWELANIFCYETGQGPWIGDDQYSDSYDFNLYGGDDVTCEFTNLEKSKVTVTKYWDIDQDGEFDEGESTLPDWTFNLEECDRLVNVVSTDATDVIVQPPIGIPCLFRDTATDAVTSADYIPAVQSGTTGEDGTVMFPELAPLGHYVLSEEFQDGWNISGMTCEYPEGGAEGFLFAPNRYDIFTLPGAEIECYVGNYQDAVLLIEKTNNRIGDDLIDGDTVVYTITVTNPVDSGISFSTLTYDLMPENIIYSAGSGSASSSVRGLLADPLDALDYVADGPATWEIGDLVPGEVVTLTYSAQVANDTEPGTYENIAFVEGWACQYQGNGMIPGPYPVPQPYSFNTLDEIEVPENGDGHDHDHMKMCPFMQPEPCDYQITGPAEQIPCRCEVVGANEYLIDSCFTQNAGHLGGFATLVSVLGNQVNGEGDPFVESAVTVVDEPETQGFVLGIQTEVLANTGTPAILPPAIGLLVAGVALTLSGGRGRKNSLLRRFASASKHLVIALALVVGFSGSAMAATGSGWQLNVVDLPDATNNSSIDIAYQVASVNAGDTFEVTLWQDGTQIDMASVATAFGDNGSFSVADLDDGTYEFAVMAENSDDPTAKTETQNVTVDTEKPDPVAFEGSDKSANNYNLDFTVPAGSDGTVVNIYASSDKEFKADSSTLVGSVAATPGADQNFQYTSPDSATRYFAIEVIDAAGNASALVGDSETVVTGGGATSTAVIASGTSAGATGSGGTASGVAGTDADGTEVLGEEDADGDGIPDPIVTGELDDDEEDDESTSARGWITLGVLAVLAAGYVFRQRTS